MPSQGSQRYHQREQKMREKQTKCENGVQAQRKKKIPDSIPGDAVALGVKVRHNLLLLLSTGWTVREERHQKIVLHTALPLGHDCGGTCRNLKGLCCLSRVEVKVGCGDSLVQCVEKDEAGRELGTK